MKLPVLLQKGSLTAVRALHPSRLSMTLKLTPPSLANMSLPSNEAGLVSIGDWVNLFSASGSAGVFIVVNKKLTAEGNADITLNDATRLLTDSLIFSEWNGKQQTKTPRDTLKAVLEYQPTAHFVYGGCAYGSDCSQPWTFEKQTVLAAINDILSCLEDSQLSVDYSAYPFKLSIIKTPTEASFECRMNRGMVDVNVTEDRSQMITRLYPIGSGDLHIDGDYVERNTSKYGIIEQTKTNSSIKDKAQLRAWAQTELKKYAKPVLTCEVTGKRLKELTGSDWDDPQVGAMCRIHFDGNSYEERIEQVNYSDLIGSPDVYKLTIGHAPITLSSIVKKSGGGGGAKKTEDKVQDAAGDWYYVTFGKEWRDGKYGFFVDAVKNNQFLANLTLTYDEFKTTITDTVNGHSSKIQQNADSIALKVDKSSVTLKDGKLTVAGATLDVPSLIDTNLAKASLINCTTLSVSGTCSAASLSGTSTTCGSLSVTGGSIKVGGTYSASWKSQKR